VWRLGIAARLFGDWGGGGTLGDDSARGVRLGLRATSCHKRVAMGVRGRQMPATNVQLTATTWADQHRRPALQAEYRGARCVTTVVATAQSCTAVTEGKRVLKDTGDVPSGYRDLGMGRQHAPSTSAARLRGGHRQPTLPSAPTKRPTTYRALPGPGFRAHGRAGPRRPEVVAGPGGAAHSLAELGPGYRTRSSCRTCSPPTASASTRPAMPDLRSTAGWQPQ